MPNLQLLLEAERRGILPANKKSLLDEARRRGLVADGAAASKDDYYEQLYGAAQAAPAQEKPLGGFWDTFFDSAKTLGLGKEAAAFAANPTEESRKAFIAAGDSKFRGVGFGEGENWAAFKQLLGGSLGQMAAPIAAATAGSFATPVAGAAAGVATSTAQYEIQNLLRQAQEQDRAAAEGRAPQELELGKSLAASAVQAGLDVAQAGLFAKLLRAFPLARNLVLPEKEAAEQAVEKIVRNYQAGKLTYKNGVARGALEGFAFEVPQEMAQQALERWQAGLSLTDDEAQEEYKQAAIGAAILGPLMGGAAGAIGARNERIAAQGVIEQREAAARAATTPPAPPAPPEGAAPPPAPPEEAPPEGIPPAPPEGAAPPEAAMAKEPSRAAQFGYDEQAVLERSRALGRSIRLQRLRQARPDLDTTTLDYLIEEGYTNEEILDYNKPTRTGREPLSLESYKAAPAETTTSLPITPIETAAPEVEAVKPKPKPTVSEVDTSETKTPEFKQWYGSSPLVDETGKPLVLYRGVLGAGTLPEGALKGEPREGYAAFATNNPNLAATYAQPEEGLDEGLAGGITPLYVKADEVIEFPVQKDKQGFPRFNKSEFDTRAKTLRPGQVLVARGVVDIGPRASVKTDPKKLYSYPSDVYAWGKGTQVKSAISGTAPEPAAATTAPPTMPIKTAAPEAKAAEPKVVEPAVEAAAPSNVISLTGRRQEQIADQEERQDREFFAQKTLADANDLVKTYGPQVEQLQNFITRAEKVLAKTVFPNSLEAANIKRAIQQYEGIVGQYTNILEKVEQSSPRDWVDLGKFSGLVRGFKSNIKGEVDQINAILNEQLGELARPESKKSNVVDLQQQKDVRNLALEAIKTTPTIKAIVEATGLNQPKAAAVMRGFVDEGLVEREGNKFKLIEPAITEAPRGTAPEPVAEEAAPKKEVVDKQGKPIRFYHGTDKDIQVFRSREEDKAGGAIFASPDPTTAQNWTDNKEGAIIYPVHIRAENVFDYQNPDHVKNVLDILFPEGTYRDRDFHDAKDQLQNGAWQFIESPKIQKIIKKLGHDGFYVREFNTKNIAVYEPNQINFAISNEFSKKTNEDRSVTFTRGAAPIPSAPPTTPPEAPRGTAPEPVAEEAVAEPVGRGAELSVSRPAPEGRVAAEPRGEGLGVPSEAAVRADERAAGVEPALTATPAKNARAAGLEYVRSTGKADALGLQKATGLKLSEAKVLREALIGSGAVVPVPGKANLYTVAGEYKPAESARRIEAAETTTDEAAIEAARDRAAARLRAKSVKKEAAEAAADLASERAPAPKLRPTFKGTRKGELSEDVRRAFAQLEKEEAAKKRPKEAEAQQGLDLLGGMAKPSLSRAETKVLDDIKSAARYLNTSGQMNDQDRAAYNAEISKPSPNLKKLRKLVDKVSSREPETIGEIERDEAFDTDREQYELDEETYFYNRPDEYTRRGELKPLKFRRGEGRGLPANKVSETVNSIIKGWKNAPKINVVQSVDELPGQNFPNTQGAYADGQVYLVANNLNSDAEVKATLFHEALGHFGLEQLFGTRLKEVMLDLYRTNKALREQADQYLQIFPDTYAGEAREDQIAFAVEEVIAEASAAGPRAKNASALRAAFNRVANLIRKFLNAMGFPVTYTNKEINEILIQAHGSVVAGQRRDRIGDGSVKYQRRQAEERLSTVFDVNISAPPYTNKVGDGVRRAFGNISDSLRQAAMGFLQIKDTAEIWKNQLPEIQTTDKILESRGGTEAARRDEVNHHVVKWYKMSNKISKKNPEIMNHFFKIVNLTTVYQVDPLDAADRAVLTKPVSRMDGQDRAAYDIIKEYDALPEELTNAYKELRQYYEQKSAQLFELLAKVVGQSAVDRLKAKYDSKRLKVYLPLWRKGDYWLTYTDQNNETVTSAFGSEIDRTRAIEELKAQGITDTTPFARLSDARRNGPPPTGFLGEVLSVLEDGGAPEYMVDSVYEAFLNYLPADSIRQQLRSREESYDMATGTTRYGKFGFEPDVFQAFANVATRMANQLTNLEYAVPIEESLKKVRKQAGGDRITDPVLKDVYENLVKQIDFIRNPKPNRFFDGASYFSYMWFIAGNISSAFVNTTQLPLVVAPLLGGKYGYDKAYTAMNKAMKTYFKGGFDTNSDYTFGAAADLDPKYKKLFDTAVSRSIIRRSAGYEFTEARKVSTKDYVGIRAKVESWLGWTFQNSERFNREVTLLAAFDLAYSKTGDVNAAIEEAIKLTKDAHGSALAETGPRIFQQGFGKMMFTFKRFAQAQVYLLSRLFHQAMKGEDATTREVARSQLVGIFGASFILAGVQGLPLYGLAEFLASLVMGRDEDEPFDPSGFVNQALSETGRKGLLSQMIGVDIASRTGFNGLLWREDYKRMSDVGPMLYTLEQAMGPAYAAFMGIGRGIGLAGEGEYQRAVEAIAPSYIRNAMKTLRYAQEGVRNKDGTPVVEDINNYNLMMQAIGFAPSEVSYARERASAAARLEDKLTGRRSALLDKYYAAWQEQDAEGMQEALEDIRRFNAKNPQKGLVIKKSTLRKSIAGRVTRQQQSVDGLYIPMSVRNRIAQILPGD